MSKLLLFDLDETLLDSEKKISKKNIDAIRRCRSKGYLFGICTSRGEKNCMSFLECLKPDIFIVSGGALVKCFDDYIFKATISKERTKEMIEIIRNICGDDTQITVDTLDKFYWNYKIDPNINDPSWGETIWTDYRNFDFESLKSCVEIKDEAKARKLMQLFDDCDCKRFSSKDWYKFTRKDITKENGILMVCKHLKILTEDIIAFGDDFSDIKMLEMAGTGVAMGNAIQQVKDIADVIIGSNDEDSIADYLDSILERD